MNFQAFLSHIDLAPIVYGIILALGILLLIFKFMIGAWVSLFIDIAVFYALFAMHGGTMKGGLSASVAAPLVSVLIPVVAMIASAFVTRFR